MIGCHADACGGSSWLHHADLAHRSHAGSAAAARATSSSGVPSAAQFAAAGGDNKHDSEEGPAKPLLDIETDATVRSIECLAITNASCLTNDFMRRCGADHPDDYQVYVGPAPLGPDGKLLNVANPSFLRGGSTSSALLSLWNVRKLETEVGKSTTQTSATPIPCAYALDFFTQACADAAAGAASAPAAAPTAAAASEAAVLQGLSSSSHAAAAASNGGADLPAELLTAIERHRYLTAPRVSPIDDSSIELDPDADSMLANPDWEGEADDMLRTCGYLRCVFLSY